MQLLVIDDSSLVRERLASLLGSIPGVQGVLLASSGAQALELLQADMQRALRLVVLDIDLPGPNGLHILQRIKALRQDLRVAMFTQYADSQHRARSLEGGADHFFDKSSDLEHLEHTVRQMAAQPAA